MNKLGLLLVAILTVCALPASAQGFSVGPGGVRVDTGVRDYDRGYRRRDEMRSRRVIVVPRDRRRDWERRRNRTVIIER